MGCKLAKRIELDSCSPFSLHRVFPCASTAILHERSRALICPDLAFLRQSDDAFAGYLIEGLHMHGPSVARMDGSAALGIVANVCKQLPEAKVRLCFGSYDPALVLEMVAAGVDVFDTSYVYLKATQEHRALVFSFDVTSTEQEHVTELDTTDARWAEDFGPLLPGCKCYTCQKHSRAYVHHLHNTREMLGPILLMM